MNNHETLGWEEVHESTSPEMYNEPCISGKNTNIGSGYAPINRGSICATLLLDDVLYFLGEDDCHYFEEGILDISKLPKLIEDMEELDSIISKDTGTVGFSRNNRWATTPRKGTNYLVHISMGDFIVTCDVHWVPDILKILKATIEILKESK